MRQTRDSAAGHSWPDAHQNLCRIVSVDGAGRPHVKNSARERFVPDALVAYCVAMLVTVERLTKTYGNFKAVDDVSFVVQAGEIAGLVGPNGAGKTTIIHMMLGLISPNAGTVRLFGKNLDADREQILQRLNFTSPYMAFPVRLTVLENLTVFAGIYNVRDPRRKSSNCWSDSASGA